MPFHYVLAFYLLVLGADWPRLIEQLDEEDLSRELCQPLDVGIVDLEIHLALFGSGEGLENLRK